MNKNNKEHDKLYQKLKYEIKTGRRDSMNENTYTTSFTVNIKPSQLKKAYKDKIETEEQKLLLGNALVLVDLIQSSKECLEAEGVYTKTSTGLVKENPAQKALRENIKALTVMLDTLNKSIEENKKTEDMDLDKWLEG